MSANLQVSPEGTKFIMAMLFENVTGCVLTIDTKDLHSSIPFPSPSDALFSSLLMKYADIVQMKLFDDLLALFRYADFHSDQVTMQKPEDVMDHIANHRQLTAKERNSKPPSLTGVESRLEYNPQTLNLIPELLAEYLDSQRLPFHRTVDVDLYGRPLGCETNRVFQTMSLVHRSWTDIAQRYLRQRIFISSSDTLLSFFRSPQIGPWVRQLSVYNEDDVYSPRFSTKEMPRLLTGILKRCPNITHLHLRNYGLHMVVDQNVEAEIQAYDTGHPLKTTHDVIMQLADMKQLEHLWLYPCPSTNYPSERDLWKLSLGLPSLRSLKSLSLQWMDVPRWKKEQGFTKTPTHGALIPLSSLEILSLVNVDFIASGFFTLLMNPHNRVRKLELSFDGEYTSVNLDRLRTIFKRATTTYVTTLQIRAFENAVDIGTVLTFFPSVQTFSLRANYQQSMPGISLVLPPSIRNFHFHYYQIGDTDAADQDQAALATLKAYRHVQRMFITYANYYNNSTGADHPSEVLFEDTAEYCARNDVEFKATKVDDYHPPHISEL